MRVYKHILDNHPRQWCEEQTRLYHEERATPAARRNPIFQLTPLLWPKDRRSEGLLPVPKFWFVAESLEILTAGINRYPGHLNALYKKIPAFDKGYNQLCVRYMQQRGTPVIYNPDCHHGRIDTPAEVYAQLGQRPLNLQAHRHNKNTTIKYPDKAKLDQYAFKTKRMNHSVKVQLVVRGAPYAKKIRQVLLIQGHDQVIG